MKKQDIGYRIRKLRESKDFSQENMAAELNISGSAYAKIERGETDPSAGRLMQIAKVLEVEVSDFFKEGNVEEPRQHYGFATKGDIEELNNLLSDLKRQNEILKSDLDQIARKLAARKK